MPRKPDKVLVFKGQSVGPTVQPWLVESMKRTHARLSWWAVRDSSDKLCEIEETRREEVDAFGEPVGVSLARSWEMRHQYDGMESDC